MTDVRPGYTLVDSPPSVADYLALRRDSGMHPKTEEQAEAGIHGAWAAVHVRHEETGATVGMGRVIGDGGWYFHVIDMAVLQRLLDTIRADAPPGAYVSLMADGPGQALYARHGFQDRAPHTIGMSMRLEGPRG